MWQKYIFISCLHKGGKTIMPNIIYKDQTKHYTEWICGIITNWPSIEPSDIFNYITLWLWL